MAQIVLSKIKSSRQISGRISHSMYQEGIKAVVGISNFVPKTVIKTLKKAGLRPGYKGSVTKAKFLKSIDELERAGIVGHKSGIATRVYTKAASYEFQENRKEKNIARRRKEYTQEYNKKIDQEHDKENHITKSNKEAVQRQNEKSMAERQKKLVNSRLERATKLRALNNLERTTPVQRGTLSSNVAKRRLLASIREGSNGNPSGTQHPGGSLSTTTEPFPSSSINTPRVSPSSSPERGWPVPQSAPQKPL